MLLNLTRNKLSLMSLCAQYVEPNDLDLFNEFYTSILCSITSILLNINLSNPIQSDQISGLFDSIEIINLKLSIILQLLAKFSFQTLSRLIEQQRINETPDEAAINANNRADACCQFVEANLNFLVDLKLVPSSNNEHMQVIFNENNLKLIIEQCVDNFVSILNVEYPFYFEYMLKKCLEFSSKPHTLKYGGRHFNQLNMIVQQREFLPAQTARQELESKLDKSQFEKTFVYLNEFFGFERVKFLSQKLSFYAHWFSYARCLSEIYASFFQIYVDRFCLNDLVKISYCGVPGGDMMSILLGQFVVKYDIIWMLLVDLYLVWIEPVSVKELTSQALINVADTYEKEIQHRQVSGGDQSGLVTNPGSAVLIMINSFLSMFHIVLERLNLIINMNEHVGSNEFCTKMLDAARNHCLNKLLHFYYETIASPLLSK